MMAGKTKSASAPGNDPKTLRFTAPKGEQTAEAWEAELAYDPAVRSLAGSHRFIANLSGRQPVTECFAALMGQVTAVQGGNLAVAENALVSQANTLDAIFNELARRSALNMGEYLDAAERYMRLALKAQGQCRATWETIAAIKNPPIVYARQANVTTGPQQVNNGIPAPSRAREIETEQTQLSGGSHELLPDPRASGKASRANPALETLGEIDRAEVPRGESTIRNAGLQGRLAGPVARPAPHPA